MCVLFVVIFRRFYGKERWGWESFVGFLHIKDLLVGKHMIQQRNVVLNNATILETSRNWSQLKFLEAYYLH